jgi:hypothetical protein
VVNKWNGTLLSDERINEGGNAKVRLKEMAESKVN